MTSKNRRGYASVILIEFYSGKKNEKFNNYPFPDKKDLALKHRSAWPNITCYWYISKLKGFHFVSYNSFKAGLKA